MTHLSRVLLASLLLLSAPTRASADWTAQGLRIGYDVGGSFPPRAATDGSGGAFVTWSDFRNSLDYGIVAQHVLVGGSLAPGWYNDQGQTVADAALDQQRPVIVADEVDGAFIAWFDYRNATHADSTTDIYLQHVTFAACPDPIWPENGIGVAVAPGTQEWPSLAADGSGGVYVAWSDRRSPASAYYVQHVTATGAIAPGWPAGGFAGATNWFGIPTVASDGGGGVFVATEDDRSGSWDIVLDHLLGSGTRASGWPESGVDLTPGAGRQLDPVMVPDGAGGVVIAWADLPDFTGTPPPGVRALRVRSDGAVDPSWPTAGVALRSNGEYPGSMVLAPDGAGGAIAAWDEDPTGPAGYDVYAQRVLASGSIASGWPANALVVSGASGDQFFPRIAPANGYGAFLAFDNNTSAGGVLGQHLLASGAAVWQMNGSPVSTRTGGQFLGDVVSSNGDGAIVVWTDALTPQNIFARRVTDPVASVEASTREGSAYALRATPNPSFGSWQVTFRLAESGPAALSVLDVAGRAVWKQRIEATSSERSVRIETHGLAPGVYIIVLEHGSLSTARRVCLVR